MRNSFLVKHAMLTITAVATTVAYAEWRGGSGGSTLQDRTHQPVKLVGASEKLDQSSAWSADSRSRLMQDVSCGPACLLHLIHGGWPNWAAGLPSPMCPRPEGWSMQDLVDSARGMRWKASCIHTDWERLQRLLKAEMTAGILHVNTNHYVLLRKNPNGLVVYDPKLLRSESVEIDFCNVYDWSGYAIIVDSAAIGSNIGVKNHGCR